MLAYLVRLPVRSPFSLPIHHKAILCRNFVLRLTFMIHHNFFQIPDKDLEHRSRKTVQGGESSSQPRASDESNNHDASHNGQNGKPALRPSTNEDGDDAIDPESGKNRSSTSVL